MLPEPTMVVLPETLHDAIMFATAALVFVLLSFLFPPERRQGTLQLPADLAVAAEQQDLHPDTAPTWPASAWERAA